MAWISPNVTGPAMGMLVTPWGGVAQATVKAIPPKAQATKTAANISFNFILLTVILLRGVCAARFLAAVGRSALVAPGAAGCGRPTAGRRRASPAFPRNHGGAQSLAIAPALRRRLAVCPSGVSRVDHGRASYSATRSAVQ